MFEILNNNLFKTIANLEFASLSETMAILIVELKSDHSNKITVISL